MASTVSYRQDMPPKGGFNPIDYTKKVTFKKTNGFKVLGIAVAVKIIGFFYLKDCIKKRDLDKAERNDARIAESVFRLAETDRLYLKHLRDCRDEEKELMKDVPGWEVGTLFGDHIYHKEKREFVMPPLKEHRALTEKLTVLDYVRLYFKHK